MKCSNCNLTRTTSKKAMCWTKWKLCGTCAVRLHPKLYSSAQKMMWTRQTHEITKEPPRISQNYARILKKHPRLYTHCLICSSTLDGRHYNAKYCTNRCKYEAYLKRNGQRKLYFQTWNKEKVLAKRRKKVCQLCGVNIITVNPNKKGVSKYCDKKCMVIANHMQAKTKYLDTTTINIPLKKYIQLKKERLIE